MKFLILLSLNLYFVSLVWNNKHVGRLGASALAQAHCPLPPQAASSATPSGPLALQAPPSFPLSPPSLVPITLVGHHILHCPPPPGEAKASSGRARVEPMPLSASGIRQGSGRSYPGLAAPWHLGGESAASCLSLRLLIWINAFLRRRGGWAASAWSQMHLGKRTKETQGWGIWWAASPWVPVRQA